MLEDDTYVVEGPPPVVPIAEKPLGNVILEYLQFMNSDTKISIDAATGASLSYKQLLGRTCTLAASLLKAGYNQNTMITIYSENCIEYIIPVISALYIGATVASISHFYSRDELLHALNIAKPTLIFCSKEQFSKIRAVQKEESCIKKILVIDDPKSPQSVEMFNIQNLVKKDLLFDFKPISVDLEHLAFILYSSGTTGVAKGVMISQKNVLAKLALVKDSRFFQGAANVSTMGILPFFHVYGLFVYIFSLLNCVQVIVMRKFKEQLFLTCIAKYRITGLSVVPSIAVFLAKSPLVPQYDLSSVKYLSCGSAPLSQETEELLKKRLNLTSLRQSYGLTESTLSLTYIPIDCQKFGSSGLVLPYHKCKIRDPKTGKSLGCNQTGEICLKGLSITKGYYRNLEATKRAFTSDGWFLTGDLGYFDDEKFLYIVGRLKELIKYKGYQVAPVELELVLLKHPKIIDCGVVGIPDEKAGELPVAFVVKKPDCDLTEKEVEDYVAERVAHYKKLRGGVFFVLKIPKTPSGKILRKKLKILYDLFRSKY